MSAVVRSSHIELTPRNEPLNQFGILRLEERDVRVNCKPIFQDKTRLFFACTTAFSFALSATSYMMVTQNGIRTEEGNVTESGKTFYFSLGLSGLSLSAWGVSELIGYLQNRALESQGRFITIV